MKQEKSCGAIVYKVIDDVIYYYIIKQNRGHYAFPKGHVEEDETEEDTALREVKEETNLDILLDTGFREISTYSPKENVMKDVIYFVAIAINDNTKPQKTEVSDILLMRYKDAYKKLTYDRDKEILEKANVYIMEKNSYKN